MALVKNPAGGIAASGKIGGTVFARNRAGQYARAWAKPVNPGTVRQSTVRGQFANVTTAWAALTQAQRDAWEAYANTMTRLNRLGEPYTPKGRQIFMEVGQNQQQLEDVPLTVPGPTNETPSLFAIDTFTAVATAGVLTELEFVKFDYTVPSGGDGFALIEAAPSHEPKLTNVNNRFRQILMVDAADTPVDILAAYIALYGSAVEPGQIVSVRARVVDKLTGLGSAWLLADATITGT